MVMLLTDRHTELWMDSQAQTNLPTNFFQVAGLKKTTKNIEL